MYYWNQDNFEGLKALAALYAERDGFAEFSEYCRLREQGLKKPAMAAMNRFVASQEQRSIDEQRQHADELSALILSQQDTHQLGCFPLTQYLQQVLHAWREEAPQTVAANKWLGCFTGDIQYFEQALQSAPDDIICLRKMALHYLDRIDFQMHHLSESVLLGDEATAEANLQNAKAYIERITDKTLQHHFMQEWQEYQQLLQLWQRFTQQQEEQNFVHWCEHQGSDIAFGNVYYYQR